MEFTGKVAGLVKDWNTGKFEITFLVNEESVIKENYDRISITLPKGTKERIKSKGESINGYITRLVLTDLDK